MTTRASDRDGIQKFGPQVYRVVVELPRDADGNRQRVQRRFHGTLKEAQALQAELRQQMIRGQLSGRPNQTLEQYVRSWLESKRGTIATRTHESYTIKANALIAGLGKVRLCDLTTQRINDYYATCRTEEAHPIRKASHRKPKPDAGEKRPCLSPTTVHNRHVVLKMALKAAVDDGIILRNPADKATPPRPARVELHLLDESEAARLLEVTAGTEVEDVVWLALHSGARLGELLALRWRDLDFERGMMHVRRTLVEPMLRPESADWFTFKEPKNGNGRALDLDARTMARLRKLRATQARERLAVADVWRDFDLVFPTYCGEPQRPSAVSTRFRSLAETVELGDVRFHDLRHGHASILLRQGTAPHVVQRRLGHSDPAFTLRVYAGVLPGQQKDAADGFAAALNRARKAL